MRVPLPRTALEGTVQVDAQGQRRRLGPGVLNAERSGQGNQPDEDGYESDAMWDEVHLRCDAFWTAVRIRG